MAETVPFLPQVNSEKTTWTPGGDIGVWREDDSFWTHYAKSMDLQTSRINSRHLTSIPDIWARALFFHNVLLDRHHPAHLSVLDEWKGLLGILCLAQGYNIPIRTESVVLPELEPQAPIARLLKVMPPDTSFLNLYLIYVNNNFLGVTSPLSFAFVVPHYRVPVGIPWKESVDLTTMDGRLEDRVECLKNPVPYIKAIGDAYSESMLKTLTAWIQELKRLRSALRIGSTDQNTLNELLEAWEAETGTTASNLDGTGQKVVVVAGDKPITIELPKINATVESQVLVREGALRSSYKGAVPLVCWSGWAERRRVVWGPFLTNTIGLPEQSQGNELISGQIPHPFISPKELFFTEVIVRLPASLPKTMICGAGDGSTRTGSTEVGDRYLLPLKSVIFKYFAPAFLDENLRLVKNVDETVTVTLSIPLSDGTSATIRRDYASDLIIDSFESDVVALWPNVIFEDWKHYYLFAVFPTDQAGAWTCRPCSEGSVSIRNYDSQWLWKVDQPIDGIVFSNKDKSGSTVEIGVIIPRLPRITSPNAVQACDLAIDFGTSNTAVAIKTDQGSAASMISFDKRMNVLMTAQGDFAGLSPLHLATRFLTPNADSLNSPFSSVYYPFSGSGATRSPWLDGNIPFEPFLTFPFKGFGGLDYNSYRTGLKWAGDDQNLMSLVDAFLEQIFVMSFLEARVRGANVINLHWTYPSAYEKARRVRFQSAWTTSFRKAERETGVKVIAPEDILLSDRYTEGVAVCRYAEVDDTLRLEAGADNSVAITVDIGGGTSDIACWRGKSVLAQSSVLLAGNVISSYIKSNESFCRELLDWAGLQDPFRTNWEHAILKSPNNYASAVNELFRRHGQSIYDGMSHAVSPEAKRMKAIANCLFGGLTFYAGMMVASAPKSGTLLELAELVYAGNVSRLLGWYGEASTFGPILKQFLLAGFGEQLKVVQVKKSPHPKTEAALGVISGLPEDIVVPNATTLLGEEARIAGVHRAPTEDLGLLPPSSWKGAGFETEFPIMSRFVATCNDIAKNFGYDQLKFTEQTKTEIRALVQGHFTRYAMHPDDEVLTSPYIIGLRHFIGTLSRKQL